MFDWNDQELTNIIWGEAGECDDHIVPYPQQVEKKPPILFGDSTKKEANHKTANVSHVEQKNPTVKSEHGVSSWPDEPNPSLSDAVKSDHDYTGNDASNNITKHSKNGSLRVADETAQFDKDSEVFHNPPENGEQVDFVDYGWANIGSFDDLDRIFSNNDDPIFGDVSVGKTDELWTSSKDITSSPLRPTSINGDSYDLALGPLRTSSDRSEDLQASVDTIEHSGDKSKLLREEKTFEMDAKVQARHKQLDEKGNKQKRLLEGKKLGKKSEVAHLHDLCGKWSSSSIPFQQLNSQYAPSTVNPCPPLAHTRPESMQQKQFPVPLMAPPPVYGNMVNYYPAPSIMAQSSGYVVPTGNANTLKNPPSMTPKEKIEKLRRRQQMRAILAIKKQQQQFGKEAPANESLVSIPSLDPSSPVDRDDCNTSNMAFDNCSVEESVLYRLQDTIAKLDIQIRLCIRDSLYRLAESAVQRQYSSDTRSTNTRSRDEVIENKDDGNQERFTRMADVETDTNPIDRKVAHLLFHRPLELYGKPSEAPQSPIFANPQYKRKAEHTQMTSPSGSKTPRIFSTGDQFKNSPCLDTFESASKLDASK